MKAILVLSTILSLQGCAWMAAHPLQSAAVATGAAVTQSVTGVLVNLDAIAEHHKEK